MSNELRQPASPAQVCEIIQALPPGRVQNQETLHERGFVVAPLSFLNGHVLLPRCPAPQTNACTTSGIPPRPSRSLEWLGLYFEQLTGTRLVKALAFGACRAIVRESHTLRCEFLSTRVFSCRGGFHAYPWALRLARSHRATTCPRYRRIAVGLPLQNDWRIEGRCSKGIYPVATQHE